MVTTHRMTTTRRRVNDLVEDLARTGAWCHTHVSDHSGFHHRQNLWVELLFGERNGQGVGMKRIRRRWPPVVKKIV